MKSGNVALSSSKGEVEEDVCWTRAEMEMERRQKQKDRKVLPEPEEGRRRSLWHSSILTHVFRSTFEADAAFVHFLRFFMICEIDENHYPGI